MKSSTIWHEHSTRPSLPAGTARKASGHLSGRGPSILLTQDRSAPQSSYSHYSGINYSALEVAVRRIQQDFDFLMRYLPKLPDDSYAKTETLKILKQHKAYMAQFEEMLNDKEIA